VKVGVDGFVVLTFSHHGCDLVRLKLMSYPVPCSLCITTGFHRPNASRAFSPVCGNEMS
jgi:hypothetical protein